MNYAVDVCPEKFTKKNNITAKVYLNKRKLSVHWLSQIPIRYKMNAIISDLNRATSMAIAPVNEIP